MKKLYEKYKEYIHVDIIMYAFTILFILFLIIFVGNGQE